MPEFQSTQHSNRDLYCSAWLYAKGVKFLGVQRQGQQYWFVFEDPGHCRKLEQDFYSKTAQVNAKEYAESLRTLKNLIFTNKNYE